MPFSTGLANGCHFHRGPANSLTPPPGFLGYDRSDTSHPFVEPWNAPMPTEYAFRVSTYLSLALACVCLGYA